jgi:hypothetical protein
LAEIYAAGLALVAPSVGFCIDRDIYFGIKRAAWTCQRILAIPSVREVVAGELLRAGV